MKYLQLPLVALTAVSGMAFAPTAFSQTASAPTASNPAASEEELGTIVVTATRTAQTTDETLASVTVITREEIERRQLTSVEQLLRGVPGLSVAQNGGRGSSTSVFVRGTESDQVLVLIDGIKVGSATLGSTAFQHLPIAEIERIEIVRGPRSAQYGSEAIGGVIQIFTRSGAGSEQISAYVEAGVGRYNRQNVEAGISGQTGGTSYALAASYEDTDGFDSCNDAGACFTDEPDDDGYRSSGYSLRIGQQIGSQLKVDLNALVADGDLEFDSSGNNESDTRQQVLGLKTTYTPSDSLRFSMAVGQSRDESDGSRNGGPTTSTFDTERNHVSAQADIALSDNIELVIGGDYVDDQVSGTTSYEESSRYTKGGFAQLLATAGSHDFEASFRGENNEQFGSQQSGGIAWGWALGNRLRLVASAGSAFKAPTFNELYFPGFGNADLEPETSRSAELALRGTTSSGNSWSLSYYQTRIDDLIAFDLATFLPQNVSEARIQGAEATYSASYNNWLVNASLSFVDAQNRDNSANHGNLLPRRARYSFQLDADRSIGAHSVGATLYVSSSRYNDLSNAEENKLGGYALLDLRAEWAFSSDVSLRASLENALDQNHETAGGYNTGGRIWNLALRYQPE